MSTNPVPICGFDIFPDGTGVEVTDVDHPLGDAAYRWLHFDLKQPNLSTWLENKLSPLARQTLLAQRTRPRLDLHDDGLILTLRGINLNEGAEVEDMVSLRIWATERLVVTVRRLRIFAMEDLMKQVRAGDAPPNPARMIARITENLVDRIETVAHKLDERANDMEIEVYDRSKRAQKELAPLRRSAIKLRRHLGPLSDALTALAHADTPLIPRKMRNRLRDTANRTRGAVDEVHEVADRLTALSDHLDMSHDARLGQNSYLLSIIAAVFLPLSFITGLFGVNVAGMPGSTYPHAFAVLTGAMVLFGVVLLLILRWIKWF